MSDTSPATALNALPRGLARRVLPGLLTLVAMVVILVVCGIIQPRIWSQAGLTLIMSPIVALAIASMAQMVMMSIGDIDLSIGFFVGMVTAIVATSCVRHPSSAYWPWPDACSATPCLAPLYSFARSRPSSRTSEPLSSGWESASPSCPCREVWLRIGSSSMRCGSHRCRSRLPSSR